jgi:cytochrome c oxidase assembly protein subunit 15
MASLLPSLRRAAPKLSLDFFICHKCAKQPRYAFPKPSTIMGKQSLGSIRFNSTAPLRSGPTAPVAAALNASESAFKQAIQSTEKVANKKSFPQTSSKSVAYWLLGSAASVFGIVVFGGLTRLTESGYVPITNYIDYYLLL